MFALIQALLTFLATRLALKTNAGQDFQARVMADTSSNGTASYAAANYIGLSTATTAPNATDTYLVGPVGGTVYELWASGGGLNRAQATYAHSAGVNTYTLTKSFTATTADGASNQIQKIGVFNKTVTTTPTTTDGSMVFETAVPSPPTLVSSDQLTITETVTM